MKFTNASSNPANAWPLFLKAVRKQTGAMTNPARNAPVSTYDVVVAGAGVGGVCAAIAAARGGCRVALLEASPEIGGTGVHSPVGLMCTWFDKSGRYINRGIFEELLPYLYVPESLKRGVVQTYDEHELKQAYLRLLNAEPTLDVLTNSAVTAVVGKEGVIRTVGTADGRIYAARVFIDSTADGNLAAAAGAEFQKGREGDGKLQPSTLTFRVDDVDFTAFGMDPTQPDWVRWDNLHLITDALNPLFRKLREAGLTSNPKDDVLCFPDRKGRSILFNQTRIANVDPTDPDNVRRAIEEGRKQIGEFWEAVRPHPAFAKAHITISERLGVREGRRIVGDYMLTAEDCLGEAKFDDMVAACGYAIDIHDPNGTASTRMQWIPGKGYYHIPYRCLMAKGFSNLLLGSRCISGTHEAHSSYRVIPPVSSLGQAAGTAAALCVRSQLRDVRDVSAAWIRHELTEAGQFAEGASIKAPSLTAAAT
jgi:choline dehydrogenase-like flavoprotein